MREPTENQAPAVRAGDSPAPLESILCTEELDRRPARRPDYETENRALTALTQALADSPHTILQTLADTMLEVFQCDSAGVSLLTKDGKRFYWPAIAGRWQPHVGGGTPRDFGPCGDVLDRNVPLLFRHIERRYDYFMPVTPPVEECLLVPFYVNGKAAGTIWAVAHDNRRRFDAEDLRQLTSLGRFASAAYQSSDHFRVDDSRRAALNLLEDAVASREATQKLNLELTSSDRRKNEFLAMLAHELRNPLASLRNATDVLRLSTGDAAAAERSLKIMGRQILNMSLMIDDLLDAARFAQGKAELRKEGVELNAILTRAVESARHYAGGREQEIAVSLPAEPVYLDADPARLDQVFGNLLNNASKYTRRGGHIWLSAELAGDEAVIRVRDDGIGIAPEMLPRVFALFAQADRSLDREGGLGIGLTLAKSLVELHGGSIEAHSTGLKHGSEFVVRLPAVLHAERAAEQQTAAPPVAARRVLVVDDNIDAAESLAMLLSMDGHVVRTAYDGPAALETAGAFQPEAVVLDIGLPGMNGYEVARRFRAQPGFAKTLLIALTGYGLTEDRRLANDAGINHHLTKPADIAAINELLGGSTAG